MALTSDGKLYGWGWNKVNVTVFVYSKDTDIVEQMSESVFASWFQ